MTFPHACSALYELMLNPRIARELYPQRTCRLLKEWGFDPGSLAYIHVGGTKGKGSLSRTVFRLLSLEGLSCGLFTSPHILSMTERIEDGSGPIGEQAFAALTKEFLPLFTREKLHFFEALLFMAIVYFLRRGCSHAVLEVGVGGRYDPTNFCRPALVLMGNISLDHKDFLGNTLEKIAHDKAGILKQGTAALSQNQEPAVERILLKEAADLYFFRQRVSITQLAPSPKGSCCSLQLHSSHSTLNMENLFLKRLGKASLQNFALGAAGVLEILPRLKEQSLRAAAKESVPFRLQNMGGGLLADTAHNGESFRALCDTLERWMGWSGITLYLSLLEGKEYADIAEVLKDYGHLWSSIKVFEFPVQGHKASHGKGILPFLEGLPVQYLGPLGEDFLIKEKPAVWAGSFYSIEYLLKALNRPLSLG